ncbi:esterase/lipase family protein [Corynebacterium choanae]|uniref:Extracellular esterase EstB n=1 Tax=Corynebacterium choanae TaxID=1862358 RepID=A0A3G6J3Z5_9CORY|nr:triacylglycerol lipase [Corynebacterium choanae]AZA12795.1 Extracellular esterase EstB precursor [Corynebacterium choanae]
MTTPTNAGSTGGPAALAALHRMRQRGYVEDDWRARPVPEKPWPIVLLHGTLTAAGDLFLLVRSLRRAGWVVFTPEFGHRGTRPIEDSASQVSAYIDQVLHATGAGRCIVVAHSQGGLVARYILRHFDGATRIAHLLCLGTPNHGTSLGGMVSTLIARDATVAVAEKAVDVYFGQAGRQQLHGSTFLHELNTPSETVPGVGYTLIATRSDATVRPPSSCFLSSPIPGQVTNFFVQDIFPLYPASHGDLVRDRQIRRIVIDRLQHLAFTAASAALREATNLRPGVLTRGVDDLHRRYEPGEDPAAEQPASTIAASASAGSDERSSTDHPTPDVVEADVKTHTGLSPSSRADSPLRAASDFQAPSAQADDESWFDAAFDPDHDDPTDEQGFAATALLPGAATNKLLQQWSTSDTPELTRRKVRKLKRKHKKAAKDSTRHRNRQHTTPRSFAFSPEEDLNDPQNHAPDRLASTRDPRQSSDRNAKSTTDHAPETDPCHETGDAPGHNGGNNTDGTPR